jgi:co-chaperonin GroES (HSP10)
MIRPYGDRILIEKLDGHGKETVSAGGIHLPAVEWRQGKTKHVADAFRARVVDVGPLVAEVSAGDEVFVLTYGDKRTLTGDETPYGLIIGEDDVLGVIEPKPSEVWRCTEVDHEAKTVTYSREWP